MKIYLVRHGETTGDVEGRYGGNYDDHLTEKGLQQLVETASSLVNKGIEIVFSSPLIRAKESAEIIKKKIGVTVKTIDDIQERNYGILAGLTKYEAKERYPEVVEAHKNPLNTDPDGESFADFNQRVLKAFQVILESGYKTVVVVSHSGPLKIFLKYVEEVVPDKIGDGEVIELELVLDRDT